ALLADEVLGEEAELPLDVLGAERDVEIGRPEVAVVLGDLVLEDEVVAEGVPGQLTGQAVVLMEVAARVGQDQVRCQGLERLEEPLDLAAEMSRSAGQYRGTFASVAARPSEVTARPA